MTEQSQRNLRPRSRERVAVNDPAIRRRGNRYSPSLTGVERFEHGAADVLVDDRGVDVGDLGAVGDKRVQRVSVFDANVKQEVLLAGDDEDADQLGQAGSPVPERLDVLRDGGGAWVQDICPR